MDLNMKIDLKNIDFDKVKAFFKRKETIIAIIVIVFIIAIIVVGNLLIQDYREAVSSRDLAKRSYERIINSGTDVERLKEKISETEIENSKILGMLTEISQRDVAEALINIQQATGLSWGEKDKSYSINNEIKNASELKSISVNISKFSGTYDNVKSFLGYIKDYERKVTIDALNFSRDKLTGKMSGSMKLTFYMINEEAT